MRNLVSKAILQRFALIKKHANDFFDGKEISELNANDVEVQFLKDHEVLDGDNSLMSLHDQEAQVKNDLLIVIEKAKNQVDQLKKPHLKLGLIMFEIQPLVMPLYKIEIALNVQAYNASEQSLAQ